MNVGSFKSESTGHRCSSVRPYCIKCKRKTKSHSTTSATAAVSASLLGWVMTPDGYLCLECRPATEPASP